MRAKVKLKHNLKRVNTMNPTPMAFRSVVAYMIVKVTIALSLKIKTLYHEQQRVDVRE